MRDHFPFSSTGSRGFQTSIDLSIWLSRGFRRDRFRSSGLFELRSGHIGVQWPGGWRSWRSAPGTTIDAMSDAVDHAAVML
jgi:hypothetical protein